ncbi:hypothetical protein NUW54_g6758 [Trametes sanguinea]|uniref:Uncharacterized protein n=1 Tax=Trametes sanguinea TaxID=158606 RepID=A0ACC1PSH5_9APHY|nr:hypothetical protein NUW54_g6758 [Trametes sanguinea]
MAASSPVSLSGHLAEDELSDSDSGLPINRMAQSQQSGHGYNLHECAHHSPIPQPLLRFIKETGNRLPWQDFDCECVIRLRNEHCLQSSPPFENDNNDHLSEGLNPPCATRAYDGFQHLAKISRQQADSLPRHGASLQAFRTAYLAILEVVRTIQNELDVLSMDDADDTVMPVVSANPEHSFFPPRVVHLPPDSHELIIPTSDVEEIEYPYVVLPSVETRLTGRN